ncbi:MAG: hypothetical protein GY751_18890, partial [Bacteroidetes bacterium]|nr:hypothetical protein [Bacteroidota bacterium]
APETVFNGEVFTVKLDGFISEPKPDDGDRRELTTMLIDVTGEQEVEVFRMLYSTSAQNIILKAPVEGDQVSVKVRMVDVLGQTSDGDIYTINLKKQPNDLRFVTEGESNDNPSQSYVGESIPVKIKVSDINGTPVSDLEIKWIMKDKNDSIGHTAILTSSLSSSGEATAVFDSSLPVGSYEIEALIADYPLIKSVHNIEINAGDPDYIRITNVPDVEAGETFTIRLQAFDAGHNQAAVTLAEPVVLEIDNTDFQFGFSENVTLTTLLDGEGVPVGERASFILENGFAEV